MGSIGMFQYDITRDVAVCQRTRERPYITRSGTSQKVIKEDQNPIAHEGVLLKIHT